MRRRWAAGALLAFLFIAGCTLFPFQFSFDNPPSERLSDLLLIRIGRDRTLDVVTNLVLFLPFGIALAGALEQNHLKSTWVIPVVLLVSGGLSYAIEIIQQFIPGRFSSLTDVVSNTAGGAIGATCYGLLRQGRAGSRDPAHRRLRRRVPGRKLL